MKSNQLLAFALVAALGFVLNQTSHAQIVPFRASGSEALYSPDTAITTATGKATHMGKINGSGVAFPTANLGNGLYEWTALDYEITAANGDQIFFHGGGLLQFIPLGGNMFYAVWSGEFYVDGGTGRFSNVGPASEPIAVVAINDPFELDANGDPIPGDTWTYSWSLDGKINKGNK